MKGQSSISAQKEWRAPRLTWLRRPAVASAYEQETSTPFAERLSGDAVDGVKRFSYQAGEQGVHSCCNRPFIRRRWHASQQIRMPSPGGMQRELHMYARGPRSACSFSRGALRSSLHLATI
eukprot:6190389-Pleurochrysis_carterae.AAC.4